MLEVSKIIFYDLYIESIHLQISFYKKNSTALYMLSKTYTGKSYSVFGVG